MDITLYKEKLDEGKKLYSNTWEHLYILTHYPPSAWIHIPGAEHAQLTTVFPF